MASTASTKQTGATGEQVAANFLKNKGLEIVEMNFKNDSGRRLGEIDIIARDKTSDELVFVEVKTRDFQKYQTTLPEENITRSKLRKISRAAENYLRQKQLRDAAYRFDAVSVWLDYASRRAKVKHLRNIYL